MNKSPLYLPNHHSIGDWDFSQPTWVIDPLQYISAPTSIAFVTTGAVVYGYLLCKYAPCLTLPQGRLVTYLRHHYPSYLWYLIFRNIKPPGNSDNNNCYQVSFALTPTTWTLTERLAGVANRTWTASKTTQVLDTWYRMRVSWWLIGTILNVMLEREIAGVWTQQGNTIAVTNPLFGTETYQRPGYGVQYTGATYRAYVDDTEIWQYAP